jgi:hypothetical protein
LQKNPLTVSRDEQLSRWIGRNSELVRMKNTENADANGAGLGLRKQRKTEREQQ